MLMGLRLTSVYVCACVRACVSAPRAALVYVILSQCPTIYGK